jgi:hypothetical protein
LRATGGCISTSIDGTAVDLFAGQSNPNLFIHRLLSSAYTYISWLRLRIIEDGALSCVNSIISSLPTIENRKPLVYDMLLAVQSLSDSMGCRAEMLLKGCVEILSQTLEYCDDPGRCLIIKTVHNFLQVSSSMSNAMFAHSVGIATAVVRDTRDPVTKQYGSACLHIFTKEEIRGMKHLSVAIIESMSVLLKCSDPLTQFFAISSSGNLFFNNLCEDPSKIEQLVSNFVKHGPQITDGAANQALSLALAKLSQEKTYMMVIEKLGLTKNVLDLLLRLRDINKDSLLLQESCCIAICRIALRIDGMSTAEKERIAEVFINMLETDDQFVLGSTISGICSLGSSGLCPKQLLSAALLHRTAAIVGRYRTVVELCRTGCAVLAVFSYDVEAHEMLAARDIMIVLFSNIKAEDGMTRELVATCLCNISVNSVASNMMIEMNVVEVLATLSSSTSEVILELCAKCICNLTCNVTLHPKMIENKIMEIITMISLVRTVSNSTKLTCVKALLNLVTDENIPAMKTSGSVRVFASLSTVPHLPIQRICSKGFYLLTLNRQRRLALTSSVPALQALFNMVKSSSPRTRIRIGTAICNLLACHETNQTTIKAGALNTVKIIATMDFEELREATARMMINLAHDDALQLVMLQQPIVEILVLILQQSSNYTFECAMMAMSCLSQMDKFKSSLVEKGGITALIGTIITGKVGTPLLAEEVCRCLCHMSYNITTAEHMVANGHLVLSMQAIYLGGLCTADTALLIALTMRNISESQSARHFVIDQGAFEMMVSIITDFTYSRYCCTIMYAAVVTFIYNLSLLFELHEKLLQQGLMLLLQRICLYSETTDDQATTEEKRATSFEESSLYLEQQQFAASSRSSIGSAYSRASAVELAHSGHGDHHRRASFLHPKDKQKSVVKQLNASGSSKNNEFLLSFTHNEVSYISKTLNLLSQSPSCHLAIVAGEVMKIFKALIDGLSVSARCELATALANLAASKHCREYLIKQSAMELLIALSTTSDARTQAQCSMAIGYLSEMSIVSDGVVASSLLLSLSLEDFASTGADAGPRAPELLPLKPPAPRVGSRNDTAATVSADEATVSTDSRSAVAAAAGNLAQETSSATLKTLSSLLKDTLADKAKVDQYFSALKSSNNRNLETNLFVSNEGDDGGGYEEIVIRRLRKGTKLYVSENNRRMIAAEEKAVLKCDYKHYRLDSSDSSDCYESESGGMSVNVLMELPLPGIPPSRNLEPLDRHKELTTINISQSPLDKDARTPYNVDSKLLMLSNESKEEDVLDSDTVGDQSIDTPTTVVSSSNFKVIDSGSPPKLKSNSRKHHAINSSSSNKDKDATGIAETKRSFRRRDGRELDKAEPSKLLHGKNKSPSRR